jgi:branched-chain amino acid transport system permease protein
VLGGIGNITGAVFGALIIGFIKAFADGYVGAQWTRAIIFSILILILVFRPQGLLGTAEGEKA